MQGPWETIVLVWGVLASISVLTVYVRLMMSKDHWIKLQILLAVCMMASFPFSNHTLSTWLDGKDGDAITKTLFRFVLLGMIVQGVAFYFIRNSTVVVTCSLAMMNILSRSGLLIGAVYALKDVKEFSKYALIGDCVFLTFMMIGDVLQLKQFSMDNAKFKFHGSSVRRAALCDGILTSIIGFAFLGFSGTSKHFMFGNMEESGVHDMFVKSFGSLVLGSAFLSFASLWYSDTSDISGMLRPKLLIYIPTFGVNFMRFATAHPGQTDWGKVLIIVVTFALSFNAVLSQRENIDGKPAPANQHSGLKNE